MKKKIWLPLLLAAIMVLTLVPMTALAAGNATVYIGNKSLADGSTSTGGGTITLDKAAGTLTLDGVAVPSTISVYCNDAFTIVVKGNASIGSQAAPTDGTALYSSASELGIQIEEGATLSLYTEDGNNVYVSGGKLTVSGPGTLTAEAVAGTYGAYPSLCATTDITLNGNLTAGLSSESHGLYSEAGNIAVESANVTVNAAGVGLFAQIYDMDTDDSIPSSVTLKNSTVTIDTSSGTYHGVFCGTGGLVVENTILKTKTDKSPDLEGYSLYSGGNVTIRGAQTEITADDAQGISADNNLIIEGGKINVTSSGTALFGWNGVTITGGTVKATSAENSAILGRNGAVSITGASTSVTATSNAKDYATIRNVFDGGIHLDASVTANNTQGGKPFLGVKKDKTVAITLGENFEVFGAVVHTDITNKNSQSYFVPAGSDGSEPLTGAATVCNHAWGTPVWNWATDYSGATATFTCTKDAAHTQTVTATVADQTTDATCGKDGETVYTASVSFNGANYSDQKTVALPATGNHTYVDGKCTVCGAADPDYKPEQPEPEISIKTQPRDQIVTEGETATFTVIAGGADKLYYQWQRSTDGGKTWEDIKDATAASYTTSATKLGNDGYLYRCAVAAEENAAADGRTVSAAASLAVKEKAGEEEPEVPPTGDSPLLYLCIGIAAFSLLGLCLPALKKREG